MPVSAVEQELWRIFTYYTLHADPTSPENFKVAHFLRFAKDCQIISNKFNKAALQLELARVVRVRKDAGNDFNAENIFFNDFIRLLEYLAPMVYSEKTPELCIRRLLLENVFLLAGRRIPVDTNIDSNDSLANKLLNETFGRSIQNIFNHYIDIASRRLTQEAVAEKVRIQIQEQKFEGTVANEHIKSGHIPHSPIRKSSRNNSVIGHKEFFQFCQDFKLKSSALLSAIQVGEIYLTAVPLQSDSAGKETERFMDFPRFCKSILLMALVAFKDVAGRVAARDKVKALLLYMWRTINSREKTQQAVQSRNGTSKTVEGHAGSLNIYGSGMFSVSFQDVWRNDGFSSYVLKSDQDPENEAVVQLGSIEVSLSKASAPSGMTPTKKKSSGKSASGSTTDNKNRFGATINELAAFENGIYPESNAVGVDNKDSNPVDTAGDPKVMYSYQIAELFRRKPELGEFFFLEILSMPQNK